MKQPLIGGIFGIGKTMFISNFCSSCKSGISNRIEALLQVALFVLILSAFIGFLQYINFGINEIVSPLRANLIRVCLSREESPHHAEPQRVWCANGTAASWHYPARCSFRSGGCDCYVGVLFCSMYLLLYLPYPELLWFLYLLHLLLLYFCFSRRGACSATLITCLLLFY